MNDDVPPGQGERAGNQGKRRECDAQIFEQRPIAEAMAVGLDLLRLRG
jgi:hypothetical protein